MPKTKKTQPYIDYKTANVLDGMHDFIIHANNERKAIYEELSNLIAWLQVFQDKFAPVENPDDKYAHFDRDHFTHNIARLRHNAWEAGLTSTLFEKLNNEQFRSRFIGWLPGLPVLEHEIKDVYEE